MSPKFQEMDYYSEEGPDEHRITLVNFTLKVLLSLERLPSFIFLFFIFRGKVTVRVEWSSTEKHREDKN